MDMKDGIITMDIFSYSFLYSMLVNKFISGKKGMNIHAHLFICIILLLQNKS